MSILKELEVFIEEMDTGKVDLITSYQPDKMRGEPGTEYYNIFKLVAIYGDIRFYQEGFLGDKLFTDPPTIKYQTDINNLKGIFNFLSYDTD